MTGVQTCALPISLIAPQGNSVYGFSQAAQQYALDPIAVLRQAAELTKGAQQLAQQGLNGYNQTASLALTLQATQPAIQASIASNVQQTPASQTIKLTQDASGKWVIEADSNANARQQQQQCEKRQSPQLRTNSGLVAKYCGSCHGANNPSPKGDFRIGSALDFKSLKKSMKRVGNDTMPPGAALDHATKTALLEEIEAMWDGGLPSADFNLINPAVGEQTQEQLMNSTSALLSNKCVSCHNATKASGGLNLLAVITDAQQKKILARITTEDVNKRMPRNPDGSAGQLAQEEIALLTKVMSQN